MGQKYFQEGWLSLQIIAKTIAIIVGYEETTIMQTDIVFQKMKC